MSNKKLADNALKITIAAMMTAISVVVGIFCKNYMNFASGLFRITFENLPILITGIVYNPSEDVCRCYRLLKLQRFQVQPPRLLCRDSLF